MRDITKLSGYQRSNVKTRLEQSNLFLASGRFPLQNAVYDNKLPFSRMGFTAENLKLTFGLNK